MRNYSRSSDKQPSTANVKCASTENLTIPMPEDYIFDDNYCKLITLSKIDSPYVMKFYSMEVVDDDHLQISIERPRGTSLDQLMIHGCPSYEVVREIIIKVLKGFLHLHKAGILHKNISMKNIHIEFSFPSFTPKITRFNLFRPQQESSIPFLNESTYIVPNIFYHRDYDIKSELWCIGMLVYEILSAKFKPGTFTAENPLRNIEDIDYGIIPPCFQKFIDALIHQDRGERPESLQALITILQNCMDEQGGSAYRMA